MSHDEFESGNSQTTKIVVVLSVSALLGLALCCGGTVMLVMRAREVVGEFADTIANAATQNPAEIRALTDSMVSIEIPEGWQPISGMKWPLGVDMTMVVYSPNRTQPNSMLMLMQMKGEGADQQQMEQQMQMQSQQQGMNPQLGIQSSETRTILIDGEERSFQVTVTTDSTGNTMHQVSGVFPGRNGIVMLNLMEDDAVWDEDAVVRMLESITTETTTETPESGEPSTQESPE